MRKKQLRESNARCPGKQRWGCRQTGSPLTALGRNSSLWKKPPVIIFLLKVITSAGSSKPQCSWAQNLPVQPPPVWTSSTKKAQPCWRRRGEAEMKAARTSPASGPPTLDLGSPNPAQEPLLSEPHTQPVFSGCAKPNEGVGGLLLQGCVCVWPPTAQLEQNRNIKGSLNHSLWSLSRSTCSEGVVSRS